MTSLVHEINQRGPCRYQILKWCFSDYPFTPNYPTTGLTPMLYLAYKKSHQTRLGENEKTLGIVIKVNRRCKGNCLGCYGCNIKICRTNRYA